MVKSYFIFAVVTLVATTFIVASNAGEFNVSNIPIEQKNIWCVSQTSSCVNLCNDSGNNVDVERNTCDADTLDYQCFCMNGYSPNSTEYTQTIPFFICSGQEQACKEACPPGNKDCTNGCSRNCSATDPKKYTATAPTSTFGSSSTPTSSQSGGNILDKSDAITNIPMATINGSFVVFLTVVLIMFNRLN